MANLRIKIVDTQDNNKTVEIGELTDTAIGDLIYQAEHLIEELNEAHEAHQTA